MKSVFFNIETMWQNTITFEEGLNYARKTELLKRIAKLSSPKSPIVDLQVSEEKNEGLVIVYRPDTIPKTIKVRVYADVKLVFDKNSNEFKNCLNDYRDVKNPKENQSEILSVVAHYVAIHGINSMISEIGYVGVQNSDGTRKRMIKEPFSGIYVVGDSFDEFLTEFN